MEAAQVEARTRLRWASRPTRVCCQRRGSAVGAAAFETPARCSRGGDRLAATARAPSDLPPWAICWIMAIKDQSGKNKREPILIVRRHGGP